MKNILILIIFFLSFFAIEVRSEMLILDRLENPGQTTQGQRWSFFTDGVMGGVSEGSVKLDKINNIFCYRMIGNVTTENNGGFIQIRSLLKPNINGSDFEGIYFKVFGNNKKYFIHLRTQYTVAPWQYYSFGFEANEEWLEIKVPLEEFKKSNFYQPKSIKKQKIQTIGLVAAFDDFDADICLAEIGFY